MRIEVTLVGGHTQSRDLELLIRTSAPAPRLIPIDALSTLAEPSAPPSGVLIVDLRDQTSLPPALAEIKRRHAGTGIVIVLSKPDPDLMLSAMRAGVNECLIEPITAVDLETALAAMATRSAPTAVGRIFAFVGAKGGVGTTALAVNVATTLGRATKSGALLVDLHLSHGDAGIYLGVEPRFSVIDALQNIHKLDAAYFRTLVTRGSGRLDLLAAPEEPGMERLDPASVRALLEFAARHFEYVVVDAPRIEVDAFDGVTSIIVVTTQELPAVRAATRLASSLRRRYGQERVQVVMSRQDEQADISEEDVERVLGGPVARAFPSDYRLTMAALNKGRPLVIDNHSKLAASFKAFAHELAGIEPTPTAKASGGWLGRLTRRT